MAKNTAYDDLDNALVRIEQLENEIETRELQSLQHFEALLLLARQHHGFDATQPHTVSTLIQFIRQHTTYTVSSLSPLEDRGY